MAWAKPTLYQVEAQYAPQAHSGQALDLVQLSIDPVWDLEELDSMLSKRQPGSRPGQRLLLTRRRDVMRELAAQLAPTSGAASV